MFVLGKSPDTTNSEFAFWHTQHCSGSPTKIRPRLSFGETALYALQIQRRINLAILNVQTP